MKKLMLSLLIGLFFLISCGKDLSPREASSQDVVNNFLEAMSQGNIEKAKIFILSQLIENEDIQKFLQKKVDSYEYIEEIEALTSNDQIKDKLSKDKTKAAEIQKRLDAKVKGLSKIINESMHLVKVTVNGEMHYYGIFTFASQNLKSITSILDITEWVRSVGEENISSEIESCVS